MKIAVLHGYLLRGSGSNIYVRNIVKEFVALGNTVYLFCQERHPENYSFIKEAYKVDDDKIEKYFERETNIGAVLINPEIDMLPVYVMDKYPEFKEVKLFIEISDEELSEYIERNLSAISTLFDRIKFDIIHANHLVMMPYISSLLYQKYGVPYVITPHGSSLEYTIKKDSRYIKYAVDGLKHAKYVLPGNKMFEDRVVTFFKKYLPDISQKMKIVPLGVDTSLFAPISKNERKRVLLKLIDDLKVEKGGRPKDFASSFLSQIRKASANDIDEILNNVPSYSQRKPDEDLPEKLTQVNPQNDRLISFVGRLIPGKGLHNFLFAVVQLIQRFSNLKVIISGAGPMREWSEWVIYAASRGDTNLLEALVEWGMHNFDSEKWLWDSLLEYLNENIRKYESVRFDFNRVIFTGFLEHHYLAPLLALTEVSCFPSLIPESFGLVLLEAASACSTPVATYFSGFKGILDTFKKAVPKTYFQLLTLPTEGREIITKIVDNISAILESRFNLCNELRNIVVNEYSWSSIAKKLSSIYEELRNSEIKK
ncbi:MAG: glycosyltransferase family 4 protein [Candidatus Asgardarchaeia archaeon]